MVLFLLSLAHAIIVLFFIKHTPSHTYRKSSIILKKIGLIGMILALVGSIIFHPASNLADTHVNSLIFELSDSLILCLILQVLLNGSL